MTERENKVPLRVRIDAAEDVRLMQAANKLGLSKSTYVRWAIENSTTQVLGAPVVVPAAPQKKQRAVRMVQPPAPPEPREEPVPSVETLFGVYTQSIENMVAAVEEAGGPQEAAFDDSEWS